MRYRNVFKKGKGTISPVENLEFSGEKVEVLYTSLEEPKIEIGPPLSLD